MTLAPILISFSFRLNSDQRLISSSVASVRRKAVDSVGRHRGGGIVGIENPDFVPAPGSTATSAPSATIFLIVSGVAAACGSPASLSAATATFRLPPARARADNLTPVTGRPTRPSSRSSAFR
jgi:hypothetical protein